MRIRAGKVILLVLTAAAFLPFCAEGAAVVYCSRSEVPLHCSSTLRRFEAFLKELFPKVLFQERDLTIEFTNGPGAPTFSAENILAVDRYRLEREELELYSEIGGAILHAGGKAPARFRLTLFVCGAFRHRERAARQESRFLGNSRRFRSLEPFLKLQCVPDLKQVLTTVPGKREQAENDWFDDRARLLLEMLKSRRFKGTPGEITGAAEKLLEKELKPETLYPFVWNSFNQFPPELTDHYLKNFFKVQIPRLDHLHELSGEYDTVDLADLPGKLANHPERQKICADIAATLLRHPLRVPGEIRQKLRELYGSVLRMGAGPQFDGEFRKALAALESVRQLHRSRAACLDKLENETPQPVRMWQHTLAANALLPHIITPECQRYLDRMEEYFTGY